VCFSYQKDKQLKPANLPEIIAVLEVGENWIKKYFHFVFTLPLPEGRADTAWELSGQSILCFPRFNKSGKCITSHYTPFPIQVRFLPPEC
jgi:hypothetical protein